MKIFVLSYLAPWVTFGFSAGCGGATLAGSDGGGGPLNRCGGDCSPAQVAASCSAICGKIAQTGCSAGAECPMNCAAVATMTPSCATLADGFLRCLESASPACDSGTVEFPDCDSEVQALGDCLIDSGSIGATAAPGSGPTGGLCGDVPATVCPNIPRSGAGVTSCSGSGGGGPNGVVAFTASCQDGVGDVWAADCSGSTCTCTYNGAESCACAMTGPTGLCACCPGTN